MPWTTGGGSPGGGAGGFACPCRHVLAATYEKPGPEPLAPVSVKEVTILVRQARFSRLGLERDAETRAVPNVDEALFHDRVGQAVDNVVPPLGLADRIFEADVVLRQHGRQ